MHLYAMRLHTVNMPFRSSVFLTEQTIMHFYFEALQTVQLE